MALYMLIDHGFVAVFWAFELSAFHQPLFTMLFRNLKGNDLRDASALFLIIAESFYSGDKVPSRKRNWDEIIMQDGEFDSPIYQSWQTAYSHYRSLLKYDPNNYFSDKFILRPVRWAVLKTEFDKGVIQSAIYSSISFWDFFRSLILPTDDNPLMSRLKRWIVIELGLALLTESLVYISTETLIGYVLVLGLPRLFFYYAFGSPIMILLAHLIILIFIL